MMVDSTGTGEVRIYSEREVHAWLRRNRSERLHVRPGDTASFLFVMPWWVVNGRFASRDIYFNILRVEQARVRERYKVGELELSFHGALQIDAYALSQENLQHVRSGPQSDEYGLVKCNIYGLDDGLVPRAQRDAGSPGPR